MPKKKSQDLTIAVAAQKGGSGKTTLVSALAEWLVLHKKPFRLLDANPGQQTLGRWANLRSSRGVEPPINVIPTYSIEGGTLRDRTAELIQSPFEGTTILDLPGWINSEIGPALRYSDLLLLPMPLMVFDYLSLVEMVALLGAAQKVRAEDRRPPLAVHIIINKRSRSSAQDVLRAQLEQEAARHGLRLCKTELSQLNDFFAAQMAGRSAVTFAPSGKAAQQVGHLAGELGL